MSTDLRSSKLPQSGVARNLAKAAMFSVLFLGLMGLSLPQVSAFQQSGVVAIRGARVIDGTGAPAQVETVVVRGGRIEAVGEQIAIPADARVIDATGLTLMPGLMDLHTHLHSSAVRYMGADWGKVLKAYLACGVTTVNDFSAYGEMFAPERELLSSKTLPGPHVNLAVRLSTPGGHGTESGWGDSVTLPVNTPDSAHAAMRQALAYKPDVIKVFTDGWRYGLDADLSSMNVETLRAIVEDAHAAGLKVFTHTVTLEGAKVAVRAGVDVLAHGVGDAPVDDELIRLMKEKGTAYVSTMAVYEPNKPLPPKALAVLEPTLRKSAEQNGHDRERSSAAEMRRWQFLQQNVRKLYDAGVPIGIGTDAGMPATFHGWSTLRELELLAGSGISPLQAITAGTGVNARLVGETDRGTIQPGKVADLLLVHGKPDENISDIERTARVFLDGAEVDLQALQAAIDSDAMTPIPSRPVAELVADFERNDGRTNLNTLPIPRTDPGVDHSQVLFERVQRSENDHALMVLSRMGPRKSPHARVEVPLTPGSVEAADVSRFSGLSFEVRGQGEFHVLMDDYELRSTRYYEAGFAAGAQWHTVRIPFTELRSTSPTARAWDAHEVRTLLFELADSAGKNAWLEIDNIRFYQ